MISIIIAFSKIEHAKVIKNALTKNEYDVNAVCTTGTSVISFANQLDEGIIVCGYKLKDMHYSELMEYLPKSFDILLVASPTLIEDDTLDNVEVLTTPLKLNELLTKINIVEKKHIDRSNVKGKPKSRTTLQHKEINKAKEIIMKKNNYSEEEAYRYIQKTSMDNGTSMTETAQMIIRLLDC